MRLALEMDIYLFSLLLKQYEPQFESMYEGPQTAYLLRCLTILDTFWTPSDDLLNSSSSRTMIQNTHKHPPFSTWFLLSA